MNIPLDNGSNGNQHATTATTNAGDRLTLAGLEELEISAKPNGNVASQSVQAQLAQHPELRQLGAELGQHAAAAWIAAVAAGDGLITRTLQDKLEQLKADLLAAGASPLEALLVEHIAVRWIANHALGIVYAQERTVVHEKRAHRAGKQLERAIASLAAVRGLLGAENNPVVGTFAEKRHV